MGGGRVSCTFEGRSPRKEGHSLSGHHVSLVWSSHVGLSFHRACQEKASGRNGDGDGMNCQTCGHLYEEHAPKGCVACRDEPDGGPCFPRGFR